MSYQGDIILGNTIDCKFTTVSTTGVPTTLAGSPAVAAYVGNGTTEITAGITLSVDFDGRTGYHNVRVVASSGNGFATASDVSLAITTGTVGGSSVVGYEVASFSIGNRSSATQASVDTLATYVDTEVSAIKAKTDQLVFTVANRVDASATMSLTAGDLTSIADALLKRDFSAVSGEAARSLINAARFLRNKWSVSGTTLTVTKEDDTTSAWTSTLATNAAAEPIVSSDPA